MRSRRSLPRPLAQHLVDSVDEAALARVWDRVRSPRRRRWLTAVTATSVALAGLAYWLSPEPTAPPIVEAPALGPLEAVTERARERLADGSELVLAPGARVEPLAVGPARVVLHQTRGRVEYRVTPERARSFVVEAWPISVEVTGTRFVIAREPERTRVEVLEGSVIVRGDGVPDGVVRLGAGEQVEAATPGVRADAEQAAPEVAEPAPDPAPAEPSAPRLPSPAERVDDWLAEADRARSEGRPSDAVAPLERVAASGGRRAALAHYTLGRLFMDELDEPARAAEALASAIDAGLPRTLEEPARHRHWAALVGAGRTARAVEAARGYLAAHPDGAHADPIRRWLEQHAP